MIAKVRSLITYAVVTPLVVMAAVGVALALEVRHLVGEAAWVEHTDQVIRQANRTERLLFDADGNLRSFLFSGDPAYVAPYARSGAEIATALDVLTQLLADDPAQAARATALRRSYEIWSGLAAASVARVEASSERPPSPSPRGEVVARRTQMESIRATSTELIEREEVLRGEREKAVERANALLAASGVAVLFLLAATLLFVTRRNVLEVTSRFERALDAERAARHEAEDALKVRENFVQMASHELKTPVTSLRLQLESILRTLTKQGETVSLDRIEQKGRAALRQLTRLQELISALLDVQRLSATSDVLLVTEVDAVMVLQDALGRIEQDARDAGSTISVSSPPQLSVRADPMRLDQVMTNLLTNALKYGRRKPIAVTLAREGDHVLLRVRDEGIGIDPTDQARIFDRFERAVSDEHFHGFGLGLWIVRSLLEKMGGTIRVESALGEGSTFVVTLPAGESDTLDVTAAHARSALIKLKRR